MITIEKARHIAGQCWTDPETRNRKMDPELAEAFAKRLVRLQAEPFVRYGNFVVEGLDFSKAKVQGTSAVKAKVLAEAGISGESGEVSDLIKKEMFHGEDVNREEMVKELGDVLWYVQLACLAYGTNLLEVMHANIDKLCERYPERYGEAENWHMGSRDAYRPRPPYDGPDPRLLDL